MPAKATELLTLKRVRNELRIPEGDTGHDDFLQELVVSAGSFVSRDLKVPVVDQNVYMVMPHFNRQNPINLTDPYVIDIQAVRYQANLENPIPGFSPDEVSKSDYSVISPAENRFLSGKAVLTPNVEWPITAFSEYSIYYKRGISSNDINAGSYINLMILHVRAAYNGEHIMAENSAYERISGPLRSFYDSPYQVVNVAGDVDE